VIGHRASGVPGSVAGLAEVHRRYGSLPWRDLVEPAAHLAETGFTVDAEFARSLARKSKTLARFPASAALFVPGGRPVTAGARFADPDLAATLRRIAERGPDEFYRGRTADLLVAEMRRGGGLITGADLRTYRPRWRAPIELDYRGRHVVSMPPPSSGGLVLGLALEALEGWDLGRLGWHSPGAIHLQVEILRRAFARRNTLLGDPDFVRVPIDRFLGPAAVADLRRSISMDRATPSAGIEVREGQHTTHVSVVDARGGAVAMTTTINLQYGSGVTVTGAGFLLNNEMDDFAVAPGRANEFGLVQGEENAIAPGKRMLSSMSPTIVVNAAGDVELVTGAAGGPTIITAVLQVIVNTIDYHMGIAAAVAAPRFHHQHLPDSIFQERGGFEPDTLRALAARGHELLEMPYPASAPSILRERGGWTGASDPRRAVSPAAIGF
jgi:gamma-glutamyltranspeptidase/glutathione hydrolase